MLQEVVDTVLVLLRADSAGVTIVEPGGRHGTLRWHAIAGAFRVHLMRAMPCEAIPCGTVIARNEVLLFDRPERFFLALQDVGPPIFENLVAPWTKDGEPAGTLWAAGHSPERRFDAEDARLLGSLARFASAAWQTSISLTAAQDARAELEQRVADRTRALAESERRLQQALSIETVGVLFSTLEGRTTGANAAFERMSGYSAHELVTGLDWEALTPPDFMEPTLAAAEELATSGATAPYEKELFRKDGSRWWALCAPTLLGRSGDATECVDFVIDVTERKEAESALREREQRLNLAFDAANIGTFLWYPEEDRSEPDARLLSFSGRGDGERLSFEAALATLIHPADREGYAAAVERALDPAGPGELDEEIRIVARDGGERWLAVAGRTTFDRDRTRAVRMAGVAADITERKRAEAVLRASEERKAFLLKLSDALRAASDEAAIATVATRLLAEQMLADRCYVCRWRPGEKSASVGAEYRRSNLTPLEGRAAPRTFRHAVAISDTVGLAGGVRADLAAVDIHALISAPVRKGQRVVWSLVVANAEPREWADTDEGLVQETAERVWAALERVRSEEAARDERERHEELERDFVTNAAHELRTPLAGFLAAVEALGKGAVDDPLRRGPFLEHLRREATRLARLCDSLLLLAQAQSATGLPRETVPLRELLEDVAADASQKREGAVVVHAASALRVETNRGLLERVVANLVENALKHSHGATIDVRARRRGAAVVVEVADRGAGIDPTTAERAFDRFYRGDAREGDGFGLGLSIASAAARAIGAELTLVARQGGGAVARLTLAR